MRTRVNKIRLIWQNTHPRAEMKGLLFKSIPERQSGKISR
jgi:hypothetical protein